MLTVAELQNLNRTGKMKTAPAGWFSTVMSMSCILPRCAVHTGIVPGLCCLSGYLWKMKNVLYSSKLFFFIFKKEGSFNVRTGSKERRLGHNAPAFSYFFFNFIFKISIKCTEDFCNLIIFINFKSNNT